MGKAKLADYYTHDEMYLIQDDLKCYATPYGLVGFLSHLAIIYIYLRLTSKVPRVPLLLRTPISHTIYSRALLTVTLLGELALNIFSLVQCNFALEVRLIQVGKMLAIFTWTGIIIAKLSAAPSPQEEYAPAHQDEEARDTEAQPLAGGRSSKENIPAESPEISEAKSAPRRFLSTLTTTPYLSKKPPSASVPEIRIDDPDGADKTNSRDAIGGMLLVLVHFPLSLAAVGLVMAGTIKMAMVSDDEIPGRIMAGFCVVLALFAITALIYLMLGACARHERPDGTTGLTCGEYLAGLSGNVIPQLMLAGPISMMMADWVIGSVSNRLTGVPPADGPKGIVVRYWVYFALSKLPIMAF